MNKTPLILVSVLLVPFLLLVAANFGWGDDGRQRTPDSVEVAGLAADRKGAASKHAARSRARGRAYATGGRDPREHESRVGDFP